MANNTTEWDAKAYLALISLIVTFGGGLFASWMSINTKLTTIEVTQAIKFAQLEDKIKTDTIDKKQIETRLTAVEQTVGELSVKLNSRK